MAGLAGISGHPLFPAIVALWFAALFGLGSLAVRSGLIEALVAASGISSLIPAAAPPLGATARILIALTMAGIGGVLGGAIARRIARPLARGHRRRGAAPAGSALSRADYDDAPGMKINGSTDGESKRRALAIPDIHEPLRIHEIAPLPGENESGAGEPGADEAPPAHAANADGPFHPAINLDHAERQPANESRDWPLPETPAPDMAPPCPAATVHEERHGEENAGGNAAQAACEIPLSPPSTPVTQSAIVEPAPRFAPLRGAAARRLLSADLDSLSPLELIERLAISLERRATRGTRIPDARAREPEGISEDRAAPFLPAALRPLDLSPVDDDEETVAPLPYVPARHIAARLSEVLSQAQEPDVEANVDARGEIPRAAPAAEEDARALEDGYSSLLDLSRRTAQREAASDPPLPGPDRNDAERSLRDALAALQRMSGAA